MFVSYFFQADDGIRDTSVTGVQTCALPIYILFSRVARSNIFGLVKLGARVTLVGPSTLVPHEFEKLGVEVSHTIDGVLPNEIGRASCRDRECRWGSGYARQLKRHRRNKMQT